MLDIRGIVLWPSQKTDCILSYLYNVPHFFLMGSVCYETAFSALLSLRFFVIFLLAFSTSDPTGNTLVQSVVYRQLAISFPSNKVRENIKLFFLSSHMCFAGQMSCFDFPPPLRIQSKSTEIQKILQLQFQELVAFWW